MVTVTERTMVTRVRVKTVTGSTLAQALGNATIDTEPTGRGADLVISRIHPRRHGARQRAYMTLLLKK